jgi:hypothetical protein
MSSAKLSIIRNQKIITDPEDLVASTWLKGHPSLGESDEVVWLYEVVRNEFKNKNKNGITLKSKEKKSDYEKHYDVVKLRSDESCRNAAMSWIQSMKSTEFQKRLLSNTLPEFVRETTISSRPVRDTCHSKVFITEANDIGKTFNYAFVNRDSLRFVSVDVFKENNYEHYK